MVVMNRWTRYLLSWLRVFAAFSLFLTTAVAGWGGQALAAGADDPGLSAALVVSRHTVLPPWFLASAAPLITREVKPLAAPAIIGVGYSEPANEGSPITVTITASDTVYYGFDWDSDGFYEVISQTNESASNTWDDDGTYTITVRADDGIGGVVTDTAAITVDDTNPTAAFISSVTLGDEPLTVVFTDTSISHDGIVTWTWDFGDNSSSAVQNPAHQYAQDGIYTVTLTVEEADSDSDTEIQTDYVTVNDTGPDADFHADLFSGTEPLTVTFTDDSTANDDILIWRWDFGDESSVSMGQTPPPHQYDQDGVYTVELTVWEVDSDWGIKVKTGYITVSDTSPTADFHSDVLSGTEPLTVQFADDSTAYDGVTAWSWDLDGDGAADSIAHTPSFTYTASGVYTVSLTAWDADGSADTVTKSECITVNDTGPTAGFTAAPTLGDESLTVFFTDTSTAYDNVTGWSWDLDGDGATDSNDQNPSFTYTAGGVYTVSLTAWDADGSSDTVTETDYITVNNVPPTAVIKGPFTRMAGLVVLDASDSTEPGQNITAYDWDLDDDEQYDADTGITATVNLTITGIYTVGLRVTDAESTTDTVRVAITIVPASLDRFIVSLPPSSTAGVAFSTVITAEDEYGNVITDWGQNVTLTTTNGGAIGPSVALGDDFVDGVWTGLVSLTSADDVATTDDDRDVIASYDGHTGQDTLHIEPAAATDFVFSSIGGQIAGVQSPPFYLTAYDPYGNRDVNYNGFKSLGWSGLITSPNGTGPEYPSDLVNFENGESDYVRLWAYNARPDVVLAVTTDDGPDGTSNPFTVTHGAPSDFVFSTIPDQVAGASGTFTLTVKDEYGNAAIGYAGQRTLDWGGLGDSPNNNPPGYSPEEISFSGGVASLLVFTPYLVEANAQITVAEGSDVHGASNPFTVSVGSQVGRIVIESDPDGQGSEVSTYDMVVYESLSVYAAGYDTWGNYIADRSVEWGGTGVAQGQVSPLTGIGTTLTPVIGGTGTITAQYSAAITDATGLISVRAPVLEVTLSDSVEPVEAGETLTYTIAYSNTGNADATSAVLILTLDSNVVYDSDSLGSSGSEQVRTWSLGPVSVGHSGQVIVTATVLVPLDNGIVLTSVVEIDSDQTSPISDSVTTTVHSEPILSISKSTQDETVMAGGVIIYIVDFSNAGNMDATGVVVSDVIPDNTRFHSASPLYALDGSGVVSWNVDTLPAGQPDYRVLSVWVDDPLPSGTVITNTGYKIDSDQTAPLSGPDVTTAVLSPTLTVDQAGDPSLVEAGQLVTFTLTFSNTGSGNASSVVITDNLPAHTSFVWASDSYVYSNDLVVWNIGTLGAHQGSQRELVLRVTSPLTTGMPIINGAVIDSAEASPITFSNLVYVVSEPELHISKAGAPDPVKAGDQLVYTISYANTGNANATSVVITDALPAHTRFASASDEGMHDDGVVIWNLGLLAGRDLAGQDGVGSVTLVVTVTSPLTGGTMLKNTAFITCAEGSRDQFPEQTTVTSLPQLHVDVTDSPDPVRGEGTLVYTVFYSNTGNADATAVQLSVDYDARLTFVAAEPAPSMGNDTWNLPPLPGEDGTGTVVVITLTTFALAPDAVLHSIFRLRSAEVGWVSHNEATEAEAVDLGISLGYDDDTPYPGKWITYTLYYTNAGDIPATGVELTAQRPEGTTYVGQEWVPNGGGDYHYTVGTVDTGASGSVQFVVQVNSTGDGRLPPGVTSLEPSFVVTGNEPEFYTWDNQASSFVGIPDLVIKEIQVTPEFPTPNRPVTFTVVISNRGTGMGENPNIQGGGFWVDLFIDPDPVPKSYPWNGYSDTFSKTTALAPGSTREIVFVCEEGLSNQYHKVYAKVDNFFGDESFPLWQRYSLIPESDEENNVDWIPVFMDAYNIFLPAVLRNH